ncbi:MAG TPA: NADP(H)-dependent aldo-keto reductase [Gammaproteobacteria bacterium]|nr:NADP(H)-dependent aldo-keto reductase [Gammaproteobacteria bacterium]
MEYHSLGRTDLKVSALCLGTMTFGEQNSESEAHAQLDYARAAGVNFIDAAEMYPVPPRAETFGATEAIIGRWLKKRGGRDRLVLATKVTGRASDLNYIRRGPRLSRAHILAAVDGSLARLQTDYIDLYQLHWPDRRTNCFGRLGYEHDPQDQAVPLAESLQTLAELVRTGKVRHIGLSNETPWGVAEALRLSDRLGLPRVVSIQNPYSLLNRSFEVGLAEMAIRENVGLLPYSPLGFGTLSGKYLGGARPAGARLSRYARFSRYTKPRGQAAAEAYVQLARRHGLDPAQMALAFVTSRPFVTSTLIGATTLDQLKSNIASTALTLPPTVLAGIDEIHHNNPNPCP